MQISLINLFWVTMAVLAGSVIGCSFGLVQKAALRRHEKLQQSGQFQNGWAVLPGSGRRVAYLLVALALVQLVCPMLFTNGTQWWVSGGVVLGYGYVLAMQLRQKLSGRIEP
jgi:hypothetical protein